MKSQERLAPACGWHFPQRLPPPADQISTWRPAWPAQHTVLGSSTLHSEHRGGESVPQFLRFIEMSTSQALQQQRHKQAGPLEWQAHKPQRSRPQEASRQMWSLALQPIVKRGTAAASCNTPGTHHVPGCVSELVFTSFPVVCIVVGAGRITTELPRLEGQADRNQSWAVWSQDLGFPF